MNTPQRIYKIVVWTPLIVDTLDLFVDKVMHRAKMVNAPPVTLNYRLVIHCHYPISDTVYQAP